MNNFRTALFGGFNKDDVIKYIEDLRNEYYDYQKEAEKTISELKEQIAAYEASDTNAKLSLLDELAEDIFKESNESAAPILPTDEISEATNELKKTADNICDCLNEFMDKISENSIAVTVEVPVSESADSEDADESAAGISSILASVLSFEQSADDDTNEPTEQESSIFAQILSSAINGKNEESSPAEPEAEVKNEPASILDDLLPSSLFTVID